MTKQPSLVKLFKLSADSSAYFSVPVPSSSSFYRVPSFLRIGLAELIVSQLLLWGLEVACLCGTD